MVKLKLIPIAFIFLDNTTQAWINLINCVSHVQFLCLICVYSNSNVVSIQSNVIIRCILYLLFTLLCWSWFVIDWCFFVEFIPRQSKQTFMNSVYNSSYSLHGGTTEHWMNWLVVCRQQKLGGKTWRKILISDFLKRKTSIKEFKADIQHDNDEKYSDHDSGGMFIHPLLFHK